MGRAEIGDVEARVGAVVGRLTVFPGHTVGQVEESEMRIHALSVVPVPVAVPVVAGPFVDGGTPTRLVEREDGVAKGGRRVLVHVPGRREIIGVIEVVVLSLHRGEREVMHERRQREIREVPVDRDGLELD